MNYWLVGANWGGDDQADAFFRRGYWELGWDDSDQPSMAQKRDNIKPNDRIAVKSMRGKGASTILHVQWTGADKPPRQLYYQSM